MDSEWPAMRAIEQTEAFLRRNPIIAEVLRQVGKMPTAGRGLALMRQEMVALGSPPPEFHSDNQHFRVILPSRHVALRSNRAA